MNPETKLFMDLLRGVASTAESFAQSAFSLIALMEDEDEFSVPSEAPTGGLDVKVEGHLRPPTETS